MSQALSTVSSLITRSSTLKFSKPNKIHTQCLNVRMISVSPQNVSVDAPISLTPTPRRDAIILGVALGVAVAALGLNISDKALAAARRPPPKTEEQEKKDPNVSGVLAKVLASKKRKEAMKQAMAQQRERGKKIEEPPSTSSPSSLESPPS
ncbi:uncharacterized protein LOC110738709 [Chenopodium quinoa]|uniref:Uncharacterized protein n=1 Tax=Chenopodium quinoa TaxID=63459 RepID=A0A803M5Q0_CHEQI|nr:uncharacterized protein LOC110738709 [Chenopodium quinoa]